MQRVTPAGRKYWFRHLSKTVAAVLPLRGVLPVDSSLVFCNGVGVGYRPMCCITRWQEIGLRGLVFGLCHKSTLFAHSRPVPVVGLEQVGLRGMF